MGEQHPGVSWCPSAGELFGRERARGRASLNLLHAYRTSLCQKRTHNHPRPLPASQTWSGTGSAARPGKCHHSIPSPLTPLAGYQRQSASLRCGKLESMKTGCCLAVWGSLLSLLPPPPPRGLGTGSSSDTCSTANSFTLRASVSLSVEWGQRCYFST